MRTLSTFPKDSICICSSYADLLLDVKWKSPPPPQWHLTNFTSSLPLFLFDCLVSFPSPSNLSPLSLLPSFNAYIMTHSKSKAVGRTGCLCSLSEETSQASCSAYSLTSFPLLLFPEASAWEKSPVSIDDWPVMAVLLPSRLHPGSTTQLFFPLESPTYQTGPVWVEINTRKDSMQVTGARQENHSVSRPRLKAIINKCKRSLLLQRRSYHTGACGHTHASGNDCVHVRKDGHAGLGAHVGKGSRCRNGCASVHLFSMRMTMESREHSCCIERLWGGSLRQWAGSSNCSNYSSSFTSLLWSWHQSSLLKKKKDYFSGIWWRTQSLLFDWMNFSSVEY